MKRLWCLVVPMLCIASAHGQKVYRWVDEKGRVQYSDVAPAKAKASEVPCPPPPMAEDVDAARRQAERTQKAVEDAVRARRDTTAREATMSVTAAKLGPMPSNSTSEYMRTLATGLTCDWKEQPRPLHTLSLTVRVRQDVPVGSFLEAQFENPTDPERPFLATATIEASGFPEVKKDNVFFISPEFKTIRCKNYQVIVHLYRSKESRELLGTHHQLIQSRIDSALWEAHGDNAFERMARQGHLCP